MNTTCRTLLPGTQVDYFDARAAIGRPVMIDENRSTTTPYPVG